MCTKVKAHENESYHMHQNEKCMKMNLTICTKMKSAWKWILPRAIQESKDPLFRIFPYAPKWKVHETESYHMHQNERYMKMNLTICTKAKGTWKWILPCVPKWKVHENESYHMHQSKRHMKMHLTMCTEVESTRKCLLAHYSEPQIRITQNMNPICICNLLKESIYSQGCQNINQNPNHLLQLAEKKHLLSVPIWKFNNFSPLSHICFKFVLDLL